MNAPAPPPGDGQQHPDPGSAGHAGKVVDLASYVLGALSPAGRDEVRQHLAGCSVCQAELVALAPLPALLNRSRRDPTATLPPLQMPAVLRERIVNQVLTARRAQRRRTTGMLAAAAALTVLALGGAFSEVVQGGRSNTYPGQAAAFHPMAVTGLEPSAKADVAVGDHSWGTAITVRGTGWDPGEVSVIAVVTGTGAVERVGSWNGTGAVELTCWASTWHRITDLRAVQVQDTAGHVLAQLPLPA